MGVLKGLFEGLAAKADIDHGVTSWLWLVALRDGRVVQMTFAPPAGLEHARRLAKRRYGGFVLRLVPWPFIGRVLSHGEAGRALMGLDPCLASFSPIAPERWLERVAWLLGCTPEQLLSSGHVTAMDAVECSGVAPYLAAEQVRANGWVPPSTAPCSSADTHTTDESQAPEWMAAHDAYLAHLGACNECIAHRLRSAVHCRVGAKIRARYDALCEPPKELDPQG